MLIKRLIHFTSTKNLFIYCKVTFTELYETEKFSTNDTTENAGPNISEIFQPENK